MKSIEYYGARRKIEVGFKKFKREVSSAETQNKRPYAVLNHLRHGVLVASLTGIWASKLEKNTKGSTAGKGRGHSNLLGYSPTRDPTCYRG